MSVYPRWRGEHAFVAKWANHPRGLSPLARGTLPITVERAKNSRFIPAGAGNTCRRRVTMLVPAVYPRWRGEHIFTGLHGSQVFGLSPLARGTRQSRISRRTMSRFIPAGAGNTPIPVCL